MAKRKKLCAFAPLRPCVAFSIRIVCAIRDRCSGVCDWNSAGNNDRYSCTVQRLLNRTKWGLYPSTPNGFTLIEVMLVLALIAILSSIAMPSLRGFAGSTRLKSTAHAIRDMLNFARDMAITERTAYLVVFDLGANRYWLASSETFNLTDLSTPLTASSSSLQPAQQPTADQGTAALQQPSSPIRSGFKATLRTNAILGIPQKPGSNVNLERMITNHNFQTIQIDTGVDYIYFSPTGSSEDTVLYIQDRRGEAMSITVENATGRVRVQKINSQQLEALGLANESSE